MPNFMWNNIDWAAKIPPLPSDKTFPLNSNGLGGSYTSYEGWKIASLDTNISVSLPISGGYTISESKFNVELDKNESKKIWEDNNHLKFGECQGPSNDMEQVIYDVYKYFLRK
jgi:hypothetical protein